MSGSVFRFKQFSVSQDKCAMKVGTDGVLLGAWAGTDQPTRILDIGTGTGLIALMLAQRFPNSLIDAIDISPAAFEQSTENFRNSPWSNRITGHLTGLAHFQTDVKYDLIVSNPPYFARSYRSKSEEREMARNADHLPLTDIFSKSSELMATDGELCLVLPSEQDAQSIAFENGWFLHRKTWVFPKPQSNPKRVLLTYRRTNLPEPKLDSLIIENNIRHEYTAEYIELTKEFYLKF